MTKEELIVKLQVLAQGGDLEENHYEADGLLLEYIDDKEIAKAYNAIEKWYA